MGAIDDLIEVLTIQATLTAEHKEYVAKCVSIIKELKSDNPVWAQLAVKNVIESNASLAACIDAMRGVINPPPPPIDPIKPIKPVVIEPVVIDPVAKDGG